MRALKEGFTIESLIQQARENPNSVRPENLYYLSRTHSRNKSEALTWLRIAAEKGHIIAQFEWGGKVYAGKAPGWHPEEGVEFLKKAAAAGHFMAQAVLGVPHACEIGRFTDGTSALLYCCHTAEAALRPELQSIERICLAGLVTEAEKRIGWNRLVASLARYFHLSGSVRSVDTEKEGVNGAVELTSPRSS